MNAGRAIAAGGLVAAALDLAGAVWIHRPAPVAAILRGISRGVLGPSAASGGWPAALLGLTLHVVIALGAAAVFVAVARRWPGLTRRAWLTGPLYGAAVFLVMNYVIVPWSAIGAFPGPWTVTTFQVLAVHLVAVGPPIVLAAQRVSNSTSGLAPRG